MISLLLPYELSTSDAELLHEVRRAAATRIARITQWPPVVRDALTAALAAEIPLPSVSGLAYQIGCARQTLWSNWDFAIDARCFRLHDFLDWIFLLYASLARQHGGASWDSVADYVCVDRDTIARRVKRLTGLNLREFQEAGFARISSRFLAWVDLLSQSQGTCQSIVKARSRQSTRKPRSTRSSRVSRTRFSHVSLGVP